MESTDLDTDLAALILPDGRPDIRAIKSKLWSMAAAAINLDPEPEIADLIAALEAILAEVYAPSARRFLLRLLAAAHQDRKVAALEAMRAEAGRMDGSRALSALEAAEAFVEAAAVVTAQLGAAATIVTAQLDGEAPAPRLRGRDYADAADAADARELEGSGGSNTQERDLVEGVPRRKFHLRLVGAGELLAPVAEDELLAPVAEDELLAPVAEDELLAECKPGECPGRPYVCRPGECRKIPRK